MSMSSYLEQAVIDHLLRNMAYTYPAAGVWAGILSEVSDDGSTYTEFSGGNYVRKVIPPADFGAASNGAITNANDIVWTAATTDWGTATHIALFDAQFAGNMLYWGTLSVPKFIAQSAVLTIKAGELDATLAGAFSLYSRNGILDLTLGDQAFASPAAIYVGLGTVPSSLNASLTEPVGIGYTRVLATSWTTGDAGVLSVATPTITFRANGNDWGDITHVGLFDQQAGGNLLFALALNATRYIADGDGIVFDPDTIVVRVD